MQKTMNYDIKRLPKYILASLLAAIPLFLGIKAIVSYFTRSNDEEIAFLCTLLILAFVFIGRFLANIWKHAQVPNETILLLLVGIAFLSFAWMMFSSKALKGLNEKDMGVALFLLSLLSMLIGFTVKLVRDKTKEQIRQAETRAESSESELKLLQSQLSPHFLFNTLNNLYSLSLSEKDLLPPLLLKLSDLLRYSVYDARERFVSLEEELAYLDNYIEFEKIRLGERLNLTFEVDVPQAEQLRIAPMLLIVFIENAFKHGKNTTDGQVSIRIQIKIWAKSLLFSVENNHQKNEEPLAASKEAKGLGLENVKRRLRLLYGGRHDLQIRHENDSFQVNLRLDVNEN
ncbi:histidine kinase [Marinilongibacter aquaticus]|uniref:sensor histidine kinase n=1 Tax=Marinilongibacter aquaticus TaxID=2975157 RepID=UPI0021BD9B35|nr:histidine kinase [Marinilongibacter aquaticus]UBM59127.1 histidine kinase [Marinilongibacter aquaticus]